MLALLPSLLVLPTVGASSGCRWDSVTHDFFSHNESNSLVTTASGSNEREMDTSCCRQCRARPGGLHLLGAIDDEQPLLDEEQLFALRGKFAAPRKLRGPIASAAAAPRTPSAAEPNAGHRVSGRDGRIHVFPHPVDHPDGKQDAACVRGGPR